MANSTEGQTGPTDAEIQFGGVLRKAGFILDAPPVMDGEWHRVPVDGDKGKQASGSYRGFLDKHPAAVYRNFKDNGGAINWKYEGEVEEMTSEDRARMEANRREREAAQQRTYEERAAYVAGQLPKLAQAPAEHDYLVRKQVGAHGLLHDRYGNLVMPLQDVDGKIWSVQRIKPDGEKIFAKDARTHGLYYQIGEDDPSKPNIVVEGFATGATINELTGMPVKVALNAGNLKAVAWSLSMNEPNRPIVVSGDNDHLKVGQINEATGQPYTNVGLLGSEEAVKDLGYNARVAMVHFEPGQEGTDWNDLAVLYGKDVALAQMQVAFGLDKEVQVHQVREPELGSNEPPARFVRLDAARFGPQALSDAIEDMAGQLQALGIDGGQLTDDERSVIAETAESAMAKVVTYASGSDRLATSLNDVPEPHQRAAMGLARSLATHEVDRDENPFRNEQLRVAYERERRFVQSQQQRTLRSQEPEASPPAPASVAEAYLNANDVIARRKAAEIHPALKNAFALESALSKFAAETLPPVVAVRFMAAQKELIAGKLKEGHELPTVMVREHAQQAEPEPAEQ